MRSDCQTWPDEIRSILDEIVEFIGISDGQIALPIAN